VSTAAANLRVTAPARTELRHRPGTPARSQRHRRSCRTP
jgi:hypothetical protein